MHQGKETYTLLLRDKATKLMDKGVIGFAATINVCRKKKFRKDFYRWYQSFTVNGFTQTVYHFPVVYKVRLSLTEIKLTIYLLAIDDVEFVRNFSVHIADLKTKQSQFLSETFSPQN